MRRLVLILMIAMLPLRTWAGDVMAIDMAAGPPVASAQALQTHAAVDAATTAHHQAPAASGDCDDHAGKSPLAAQAHCKTCVTCQICHSVAIVMQVPAVMPQLVDTPVPAIGTLHFTSAERALSQKPPIS